MPQKTKPVLVNVNIANWDQLRTRASETGASPSDIVDNLIAAYVAGPSAVATGISEQLEKMAKSGADTVMAAYAVSNVTPTSTVVSSTFASTGRGTDDPGPYDIGANHRAIIRNRRKK